MASDPACLALVVDDDPVTRQLVRRALEGIGCRDILQASDGLQAQQLLREHRDIDLVLTDILMPGLDGLDLLRWGREELPDTPWIILSGLDTFDSAVEAIRLGAFDFLAKPPRVAELEVAVRNALERRNLLTERERLLTELHQANERLVEKVDQLEESSRLLQRDLERAEVIQRALLPAAPPPIDRLCVHALYRPGHNVGGDLYDVLRLDEHHLAIYLADATGHGVTAAMLSVLFKQRLVLRERGTGRPLSPAAVLETANRSLGTAVAAPGLFLTAVYCLLDTRDGRITLASAGHPPVLHLTASGESRLIPRTGPALGLTADATYTEESFTLRPDDRLFLYTDGLSEAAGTADPDRFARILGRSPDGGSPKLADLLPAGREELPAGDRDDVTLLLLEMRTGPSDFDNGTVDPARAIPARKSGGGEVVRYGETEEASYLSLRGRATWVHGATFFETARAIRAAGRPLVVDLTDCEYLDSTLLGTTHQLVVGGGVRLQNVRPEVRALFEELGMDRVLESIRADGTPPPELHPLVASAPDTAAGRRRILQAHEALAALSPDNREAFRSVIESMRGDPGGD